VTVEGNSFEGLTVDGTYSINVAQGCFIRGNFFEDLAAARPNGRSIYLRVNQGGLVVAGNTFGLAGVADVDYGIELAGTNSEISIHDNHWVSNHKIANVLVTGTYNDDIWVFNERNGYGAIAGEGHVATTQEYAVSEGFTHEYARGFKQLGINQRTYYDGNPDADLDVKGQAFTDGVSTFVKAGAPVDGDFTYIEDGMLAVDSTNNRLYVRVGSVWKYAALT
jgi:hypothetical protein